MGQKDLSQKNLEFYPDVFADIVNALLYEGEAVVAAVDLQAAPTETLYAGKKKLRNQFHDVSKYEMKDGRIKVQYALENETSMKRRTVLRKAGYEGAVYREQYDGGEVFPFISMVLFWGKTRWRAPRCLFQLWKRDAAENCWMKYVDEVHLQVFEMRNLPPEVRGRFRSDMRVVVDYLAEGVNYKPTLQRLVHVEAVLRMLRTLTHDVRYEDIMCELQEEEREMGGISMCELLDKYENRGAERGRAEGRAEGREEGRAEGRLEGKAEGRLEGRAEGRAEGYAGMSLLIRRLIGDGRSNEIERVVSDEEYQKRLFAEYSI